MKTSVTPQQLACLLACLLVCLPACLLVYLCRYVVGVQDGNVDPVKYGVIGADVPAVLARQLATDGIALNPPPTPPPEEEGQIIPTPPHNPTVFSPRVARWLDFHRINRQQEGQGINQSPILFG